MKIAVLGSMQFAEKMIEVRAQLELRGHQSVLSGFIDPFLGKTDEEKDTLKLDQKQNQDATKEMWALMQDCDAVLVLNYEKKGIPNYIGGNVLMEIGFAYVLNKKIFLLNPIPDISYYKSEIESVQPTILNGDLSNI